MQFADLLPDIIKTVSFLAVFCSVLGLQTYGGVFIQRGSKDLVDIVAKFGKHCMGHGFSRAAVGFIMGGVFKNLQIGLMAGIGAYILPLVVANIQARRQAVKLEAQLLDGLSLMQGGLQAGFNLYQVLELVAREADAPFCLIAGRIAKEVQLGVPMDVAWQRAGTAVNNEAFGELVTAVTIQREMGGDLGLVLETLRETIRGKINLREKLKSVTSQGRLTGMIIAILPMALGIIIYFIMPGFIEPLIFNPIGQVLLGIASALEIVGIWIMSKICRVEA